MAREGGWFPGNRGMYCGEGGACPCCSRSLETGVSTQDTSRFTRVRTSVSECLASTPGPRNKHQTTNHANDGSIEEVEEKHVEGMNPHNMTKSMYAQGDDCDNGYTCT